MTEKRFRKLMGFIQDNTCEGSDVEGVMDLSEIEDMLNELSEENEQLKKTNEKLQRELDKTREDLNYFANSKVGVMRGSDCGHGRFYVTSMQKKGD